MPKYVIESDHTQEECVRMLDAFLRAGAHYLMNTDWGCHAGVHTAWLIIEANDDDDARLCVPPVIRKTARLVRLNKFTPDEIRALHGEEPNA